MAKNDKKVAAETMAKQLKLLRFGKKATSSNRWDLVMTEISIVNQNTIEMLGNSFTSVDINPLTHIQFSDCTEKIKRFFISGYIFKNLNSEPAALEEFALLP